MNCLLKETHLKSLKQIIFETMQIQIIFEFERELCKRKDPTTNDWPSNNAIN